MAPAAPPLRTHVPPRVWLTLTAGLLALSVSPILVRLALEAQVVGGAARNGPVLVVWRTVFAAALLAPWALRRGGREEMGALAGRDWALIVFGGIFLGLHFLAWFESLVWTSVASASVLVTTSPLFIAALGWVALRERLPWRTIVAIVAAVVGAVLIGWGEVGGPAPNPTLGNGLALGGALLVSVYLLVGRAVRQRVGFIAYVFPLYAVAGLTALGAVLVQGSPLGQPPTALVLCLVMAVFPQILGHGSFNYAVRYLPAAFLGLLSLAEPVVASVIALFLFAEAPGPVALAGMALVVAAVAWEIVGGRR